MVGRLQRWTLSCASQTEPGSNGLEGGGGARFVSATIRLRNLRRPLSSALYPASRHDRPHARLYDHDLNHPAWKALSGNAFKLLVSLLASYRPNKPNSFPVGRKSVSERINVSEKTASKLVDELIDAGHLREERKGRNSGCVKTRERVVSLTRYDTEMHVGDLSLPIEVWKKKRTGKELPNKPGRKSCSTKRPFDQNCSDNADDGATIH